MIYLIIILCLTYYTWKILMKKHPDCIVNIQKLIVSKTQNLNSEVHQLYRLILFRWFPTARKAQAIVASEMQNLDMSDDLCNTKVKQNTSIGEISISETNIVNSIVINAEVALILNDNILENLLCSTCGKYLSIFPIKVYPNDIVKCGRCCKDNDDGIISHIYENLAKSCLFKCVNRYEHCTKLLTVFEVDEHEQECISTYYNCPKCELIKFSGSELLYHYKEKHFNSILEKNVFYIDRKTEPIKERYLYLKNDTIFFILVEIVNRENYGKSLYLSAISLTPLKDIKQQFNLKFLKSEPIKRLHTDIKICSSLETFKCDYFKIEMSSSDLERKIKCKVNIFIPDEINTLYQVPKLFKKPEETPKATRSTQTLPLDQITSIELTDQFKQEYPDYKLTPCGTALFAPDGLRIELTCSECNFFTGCNVFSCLNGKHIMCWECKTKQCKCNVGTGGWNANISTINEMLLLPCRWNCGQRFPGDGLRNHEAKCHAF